MHPNLAGPSELCGLFRWPPQGPEKIYLDPLELDLGIFDADHGDIGTGIAGLGKFIMIGVDINLSYVGKSGYPGRLLRFEGKLSERCVF